MKRRSILPLLVPLLLAACEFESVDSTEQCIETRYGKIENPKMDNGLNFLGFNDATCFPLVDQNFPVERGDSEIIEAQTSDPVTVKLSVAAVFRYDPATIIDLFKQKRSPAAAEVEVLNSIREGSRTALAGWNIARLFSEQRASFSDSVRAHVQRKVGNRAIIVTVFVRSIEIPAVIEQARVQAAAQAQVLDRELKQYIIDSVKARGVVLTATADAEAKRLANVSYAQAPRMIDLEIARANAQGLANVCKGVATCIIGGSVVDLWKGLAPK